MLTVLRKSVFEGLRKDYLQMYKISALQPDADCILFLF